MNISAEQSYAYAEILEILSLLSKKFVNKIPTNIMNIFKKHASDSYESHLNKYEPLETQNISNKTAALLTLIALNYWCETKTEVEGLKETLAENDRIIEEKKRANVNELFTNISKDKIDDSVDILSEEPETQDTVQETTALVDYSKVPWYKKLFNAFRRKKLKTINKKQSNL